MTERTPDAATKTWSTVGAELAEAHVQCLMRALRQAALAVPGGDCRPCKLCGVEIAAFPTKTGGLVLTVETGNEHKVECDGLDLGTRKPLEAPYANQSSATPHESRVARTAPVSREGSKTVPVEGTATLFDKRGTEPTAPSQPNNATSGVDASEKTT